MLDKLGNWRITNKIDGHNVRYMRAVFEEEEKSDPKTTTMVLAILLGISILLAIILGICACRIMNKEKSSGVQEDLAVKEGGEPENYGSALSNAHNN